MIFNPKNILRPALYHGHNKEKNYFEGWYFKIVDKAEENIFAFIPAIFLGEDEEKSHAFIQVLDGIKMEPYYHRYKQEQFRPAKDKFQLDLAGSYFSQNKIKLNIDDELQQISGELEFSELKPWPATLMSPGAMGWYAYLPFMQCYHGVLSFDHEIKGSLNIDERHIDFTGGRGYMEKDWGKSFPQAWLWMQSNHFSLEGTSLMASVALIPWLKSSFRGFIIGFYHEGQLYRFTTYTGAKIDEFTVDNDDINLEISDDRHRLKIKSEAGEGGLLYGPYKNEMVGNVKESLTAEIEVELYDLKQKRIIFQGIGRNGGLELTNSGKIINC